MNIQEPPDQMFAELFEQVQSEHVFPDSKTFVDATAKTEPGGILKVFLAERDNTDFNLEEFVKTHFDLPAGHPEAIRPSADLPVEERIEELWDILTRAADERVKNSSLIPLPNSYVVPGGRFREVYYWDSYFTMLGLAVSGRVDLINDMVENFAYLIDEIGFIPNGNRTYYCTRSQPPFFALMVELLAEVRNDDGVLGRFLPQLIREYEFWMSGTDIVNTDEPAHRRVVAFGDAHLNRYWDDAIVPRQESYAEDVELASRVDRSPESLYRDLRAGAESGWDFTSRWLGDRRSLATIRTTQVIPVDLNSLMYNLESLLARICTSEGRGQEANHYLQRAERRRRILQTLFFDDDAGMFVDLALPDMKSTGTLSIAATYPLFFGIALPEQAARVAHRVHSDFLKPGGWLTTLYDTGQQWDRPNGWAPMQWIAFCGLENYGFTDEAKAGASRWVEDNIAIYREHGRLLEKYNVEFSGLAGTGGEYEVQDGFGWTNAVLIRLIRELG